MSFHYFLLFMQCCVDLIPIHKLSVRLKYIFFVISVFKADLSWKLVLFNCLCSFDLIDCVVY